MVTDPIGLYVLSALGMGLLGMVVYVIYLAYRWEQQ